MKCNRNIVLCGAGVLVFVYALYITHNGLAKHDEIAKIESDVQTILEKLKTVSHPQLSNDNAIALNRKLELLSSQLKSLSIPSTDTSSESNDINEIILKVNSLGIKLNSLEKKTGCPISC